MVFDKWIDYWRVYNTETLELKQLPYPNVLAFGELKTWEWQDIIIPEKIAIQKTAMYGLRLWYNNRFYDSIKIAGSGVTIANFSCPHFEDSKLRIAITSEEKIHDIIDDSVEMTWTEFQATYLVKQ